MEKPLPSQWTAWLLVIGLLLLMARPSQAQSQNYLIDYTREGAWRYTRPPETLHQKNGRIIQEQLTGLGKQLNHLSAVDPPAYSTLQGELNNYLRQLEAPPVDYGNQAIYETVMLRLTRLEEQVKAALMDSRRRYFEAEPENRAASTGPVVGRKAMLLPYALLFRRADYRSKLRYVVGSGEQATILKESPTHYLVRCGPHKGYLSKGMILQVLPLKKTDE